jgi:hypothetical protein
LYGCRYYDLCFITLNKEKYDGIYEFKKGFSKTEAYIYYTEKKALINKILRKLS